MSERDKRVKAFEKLMRGRAVQYGCFLSEKSVDGCGVLYGSCFHEVPRKL
jgi:hypothetical protein